MASADTVSGKAGRDHSLSVSTIVFRSTAFGAILHGLIALAVGLAMYVVALTDQYIALSHNLARTATIALKDHSEELESIVNRVMARYHTLSDEDRRNVYTEEVRRKFYDIYAEDGYQKIKDYMDDFLNNSDLFGVYIGVYDPKTKALVYIVDPDENEDTGMYPGDWEPVEDEEIDEFLNWGLDTYHYSIDNTERWGWICTSGYPLRNAEGKIIAFVLADVTLRELTHSICTFIFYFSLSMMLLVGLWTVAEVLHLRRRIVDPINRIAAAAMGYVRDKINNVDSKDHFAGLNIRAGTELRSLVHVMADMENNISEFEDHLTTMTAEKERIQTELSLATRIQADMLPSTFPAFPDRDDFDIYAIMEPAKEVGGDFYDYFLLDSSHLGLVIADVSGKGVPAALFMMMAKLLLRNALMEGRSPSAALTEVNEAICRNNREEMFVTVWTGILDLCTGVLTAANAGHEFPIVRHPGGIFEILKDKHDFVVGGMPGIKYRQYEITLEPGSCVFLYTDGVAEATGESLELYGLERTVQALNSVQEPGPRKLCEAVFSSVNGFVQDAPQFDDITMLCVTYDKKFELKDQDMPARSITVKSTMDQLEPVTAMVTDFLDAQDCSKRIKHQMCVVVDEIFSNIVNYAYVPEVGDVHVEISCGAQPASIDVSFADSGKPFNPLQCTDPDVSLEADEREIGGLGIMMVKRLVDEMRYEYRNCQNVLTVKKFF